MLFVATYRRDTETTNCLIDGLHRQGVAVKNIQLPNLDEDTTVSMVSSMLSTRPQLCESVSRFVFHHSNGNPLYIVELLRFMHETGLAVLDQTSGRWTSVQPSVDSVLRNFDCLHEVVTQRLMLETKGVQELLKVAACLGSALNEKLLSLALSAPVSHYVSIAADRGLLVYNETSRNYCFANSMVHDASYALIPVDELQAVHLAIGRKIWRRLDEADLQQHFLLILSQFNKGKQLVTNENEKYALSTLHLQIAEMVARKSNFPLASELLDGAISLLCENHWRNRYDLSLSLFNTAAEVEYTRGNFDKVKIYIEEILRNARSLDDKLQAQTTQIYTLIANDKLEQGLDAGLKALAQLGEVFHSRPSNARIRFELMKTTRLLRGESDEKIMRLPTMQDSRKGAAMQLMNMVFSCAFAAKPMLCPLLCLRMVNLTLVDGLCAVSSFAFATYGMLLCSYNFDFAGGYRYGQLALKLLDRFGAKEWLPRVYAGVYGFIHGWNRPMELAMKPLWHAIQVGLETGDIEFAGLNAHICITIMFERGKPLNELNDRMMNFTGELRMLKQESMVNMNKPLRYMIEALIGNDNECTVSASAGNPIRGGHFESDHVYAGCWIHFQRCIVTYIFGDFETAVIEGSKAKSCVASPYQTVDLACMLLFDGLASLGLCQQPGRHRRHLITTAKRHISVIEKISCGAPEYCLGKVFLLRAELSVTTRKFDKAHSEYISAIALSSKGGLLMEEAIANERAGRCMQILGDSRSTAFLNEALELYEKWGAKAKACRLRTEILDASSKRCTPASAARPQSLH
jgi:histidine kinase